jgi:hypothetical protein
MTVVAGRKRPPLPPQDARFRKKPEALEAVNQLGQHADHPLRYVFRSVCTNALCKKISGPVIPNSVTYLRPLVRTTACQGILPAMLLRDNLDGMKTHILRCRFGLGKPRAIVWTPTSHYLDRNM